ncbi:uncharacterized protein FTJAE_1855 [Fusarium tjaetaba]|uniref:Uncharacterized protein n=1 Tax=Fusarium tjaetaba TaxID=1567544 RepID=A0A8H5S9M9_9HYPO|nr:uncharacterized protein FTJAE_1855 [Fusarium tjaetaba]KAF5647024.1 hypothetical protein FTJAE_1855 [Fusarium tjaetaba]
MSLSVDQKVRLLARQVQRFHEYSAGTGLPNSKIIKAPDVELAADLEPAFGLYMGYKLLYNGKVGASDLPKLNYEEPPKENWDGLYGPPAPQQTELEREAMWDATGNQTWPRVNEKPKPQVTGFESRDQYTRDNQPSSDLVDLSEDGDLISLATDIVPINKALCDFEPLCFL